MSIKWSPTQKMPRNKFFSDETCPTIYERKSLSRGTCAQSSPTRWNISDNLSVLRTRSSTRKNRFSQKSENPTTKSNPRSFFCLWDVYWRFIPNFIKIAIPLIRIIRRGEHDKFTLKEEQLNSLRKFIENVCYPPITALLNVPYFLENKTSPYSIGYTIFQTHEDGKRKPTGYWTCMLNPTERKYPATEL